MIQPAGSPSSKNAPPCRASRNLWIDALCLALLAAFWLTHVPPIVLTEKRHGGDIFRDAASAINIAHAQPFADPAYRGHSIWYPPLSPAIVSALSAIFAVTPLDCYRLSQLLFNWIIPAGLYLLVRLQWGILPAAAATIALLFAMPWWQSEVVQGQPSTHAVVLAWIAILLFAAQHRRASLKWAAACGLFQGLCFWHHPLIPAVLAVSFPLSAIFQRATDRPLPARAQTARASIPPNAIILALTLLIAAPVLFFLLHGPILNPAPRQFIRPELLTTQYALIGANPWIAWTALLGITTCFRSRTLGSRLLLATLAVSLLGQLAAYPRILGWTWAQSIPIFVPHEFQWTFQLALAAAVGIGIKRLLDGIRNRVSSVRRSTPATALLVVIALALTGIPGFLHADTNLRKFVHPFARNFPHVSAWVRQNTDINDVFALDPIWAFAWFNADTGRKVWLTEPGHTNPRVDWHRRDRLLKQLADASSPQAFWQLVRENAIDYCIPSPCWMPRVLADPQLRQLTVPDFLELVRDGGQDAPSILRVRPKPFLTSAP